MNSHFVFVHGWGMAPDFWDGLIDCLPGIKTSRIDLGFIESSASLEKISDPAVYITHSLGTMWALKNHHADMKALVSINGFSYFQNFTDERVLRAMKTRLKRDPKAQMEEFWKSYGLPSSQNLNISTLQKGLEWLTSWDARKELEALTCPVLSLAGQNDPLLPLPLMKEEWEDFDLHICEDGNHALPLNNPQWCTDHIKEFLREL